MRTLVATLALLIATAPAGAAELWPQPDGGFRFAMKEAIGPARERFGYVDAVPGKRGWWNVTVTCGIQHSRTGRVVHQVIGKGEATRGRAPGFGGRFDLPDGRCGSFVVSQDSRRPENLRLPGQFVGVDECPGMGEGDLSTGD